MQLLVKFKRITCPAVNVHGGIVMSEIVGNRFILFSIRFFPQTLESLRNPLSGIILPIRGLKKNKYDPGEWIRPLCRIVSKVLSCFCGELHSAGHILLIFGCSALNVQGQHIPVSDIWLP